MLIGFPVVLAPLVAAVVTAIVQVDRLAAQSRSTLLEAETATHHSRRLLERLTEMRRPYMQYQATGDDDFYAIYFERRRLFLDAARDLSGVPLTESGMEHLRQLSLQERALVQAIAGNSGQQGPGMPAEETGRRWTELIQRAEAILAEGSSLIETQANRMTETAAELQRTLLLQATAVIPATMLLASVFVVLITRPMRALGQAIRRLGGGEFSRTITVHGSRDVEELGRQLDWLRRRIQDLEQQKLTFLRHISHELKTPLTTIREGSELLEEALADRAPEEAEISRIMNLSSLRLQKLIEDLLLFGKTQDIASDLRLTDPVDLRALVKAIVSGQAVAIASKQLEVECRLSAACIRGDAKNLRIVVDNLLSNAIKYTPAGGRIRLSLEIADGCAVIDVEDTGPGIDASEAEKIFEPFQQGQAQYQCSVKGTGLGLSIAREYVEAHDGYVEVVNSAEGGHFRVRLPVVGPTRFEAA